MANAERVHDITGEIRADVQRMRDEANSRIAGDAFDIGFVGEIISAMAANLHRVADALDALADKKD